MGVSVPQIATGLIDDPPLVGEGDVRADKRGERLDRGAGDTPVAESASSRAARSAK
jgi:hypothetical protein